MLQTTLRRGYSCPSLQGRKRGLRAPESVTPFDIAKHRNQRVIALLPREKQPQTRGKEALPHGQTGGPNGDGSSADTRPTCAALTTKARLTGRQTDVPPWLNLSKAFLQDSGVYKESLTFSTTKTWRDRARNQKEHMKGTDTYANHNVLFLLREEEKNSLHFSGVNVSGFCFKMIVKSYLHLTQAC